MFRSPSTLLLLLFLLAGSTASGEESTKEPSDYLGCWIGRFVVDHDASELRIGVAIDKDKVQASLWIPEMGAGPLPMGPITVEREQVRFGQLPLEEHGTELRGVLPKSVDPSDSPEVRFRRSEWLKNDCATAKSLTVETIWEAELPGGIWASALLDAENRQMVVGTLSGHVIALETESGISRWSVALNGSVRSAPVIWNGDLYIASDDGLVRSIDRSDGSLIRKYRVANALSPAYRQAPGADFQFRGHQLLPAPGGLLVGTLNGDFRRIDEEGRISSFGDTFETGIVALLDAEDGFFAATRGGEVYRMDSEGKVIWRSELSGPVHGDLVLEESSLYVGDRGYYLWSLDPDSGATQWKKKFFFSWIESAPTLSDGVLFIGSSDSKKTKAIDPASGALLWSSDTLGWSWASPIITNGLVVQGVAGRKGYLSDLQPGMILFDAATGKKIHELPVDLEDRGVSGYVVAPVISGDLLIAFDAIGGVRAWRLAQEAQP